MEKPASLRKHIESWVKELKDNPSKLTLTASAGKLKSWWHADKMNYQLDYTLEMTVLEFNGSPDIIFLPVVDWLKRNQIDALQNLDRPAASFEADILDVETYDITISIEVSEAVFVKPRSDGKFELTHGAEPPPAGFEALMPGLPCVRLKEIYDQAGTLLVEPPQSDV